MTGRTQKPVATTATIQRHWREAVPNDRLAHLIRDASRGLNRALQMRLADHSVSFGHWSFLRILWVRDGLTQRELSDEAGVMEPTTFSALKAMQKLGYIARRQNPGNRRKVHIDLTPAGHALQRALVPLAEAINAVAVAGVSAEDVAATRRTLLRLIDNLAEDEAQALAGERRVPSTRELSRRLAGRSKGRRARTSSSKR